MAASIASLNKEIRECKKCLLPKGCYPVFSPVKNSLILIIGQSPGRKEAEYGLPFVGPAGKRLFEWLNRIGLKENFIRKSFYITQVVKCFLGSNRAPKKSEIKNCLPYLKREIEELNPSLIIPVGSIAIEAILGKKRLVDVVGKKIMNKNRTIIPLPHPSGASVWFNKPKGKYLLNKALRLIRTNLPLAVF